MRYRLYFNSNLGGGTRRYYGDGGIVNMPSKANLYDKDEAFDLAVDHGLCIESVDDSPPPLGIHVTDGMGTADKLR